MLGTEYLAEFMSPDKHTITPLTLDEYSLSKDLPYASFFTPSFGLDFNVRALTTLLNHFGKVIKHQLLIHPGRIAIHWSGQ